MQSSPSANLKKVIQRLQQHIKLCYDIENPALILIEPANCRGRLTYRRDVQEEDQVAQYQEAEVAVEDLFVILIDVE